MTDDVRKLLGGYATGTLTEAERNALFSAALEDEELFAALADEQALKELLDDPSARAELLQAAERPSRRSVWRWLAPVGALSAATLAAILTFQFYRATPEPVATMSAKVESPKMDQPALQPPAQIVVPERRVVKPKKTAPPPEPAQAPPPLPSDAEPMPKKEAAEAPDRPAVASNESQSVEVSAAAPQIQTTTSGKISDRGRAMSAFAVRKVAAPVAIDYSILKRTETGQFVAVPNDSIFRADDQVRIKVHLAGPGTLQLLQGKKTVAIESVAGTQDRTLPADGAIPLSGGSTLQLIYQATPQSVNQAFAPGANAVPGTPSAHTVTIQLRTQ